MNYMCSKNIIIGTTRKNILITCNKGIIACLMKWFCIHLGMDLSRFPVRWSWRTFLKQVRTAFYYRFKYIDLLFSI